MANRDKKTGRFLPGNNSAKKTDRVCSNYPFCKKRINRKKYPNKRYHSKTCKKYALIHRKHNNLAKKG